ncbi:hypothetical protein K490DRAFT_17245, partial [Saccharata proteae CBS 121410]
SPIYAQVDSYPWDTDAEFQGGLSAILGSNPSLSQASELTLRARCFYYSRKFDIPIDFDAYKAWRAENLPSETAAPASNGTSVAQAEAAPIPTATAPSAAPSAPTSGQPEAPYPTSFAQIVELITTGQPIPGIKEVPDTVLEGQGTEPVAAKRKKPWEKDE